MAASPWIPTWKNVGFLIYMAIYLVVCQEIWKYPPENFKSLIFKILPLGHLLLVIYSVKIVDKGYPEYRSKVVFGLLCSMVGDALLVWRVTLFLPGLLFFAFAHLFYIRAFKTKPFGGVPTLASFVIVEGTALAMVLPGIQEGVVMAVMVAVYCSVITVMTWRSVVAWQTWPGCSTFCACLGASIFGISDFLIAYDKWVSPIDGAAFYIHITYFIAQLFIASSVACFEVRAHFKQA